MGDNKRPLTVDQIAKMQKLNDTGCGADVGKSLSELVRISLDMANTLIKMPESELTSLEKQFIITATEVSIKLMHAHIVMEGGV